MAENTVNDVLEVDESLDLHSAYLMAHECGFDRELTLGSHRASNIAARLRGISGITAVLMTDKIDVELGDYIRAALIEAVSALANDCANDLEETRTFQEKSRKEAKSEEVQHG